MAPIDYDKLDPAEILEILEELQRRHKIAQAEAKAALEIDQVLWRKWKEEGVEPGDPWKAPTHHVCAYPKGWVTSHKGGDWEAVVQGALSEPGVDHEWEFVPPDDQDDDEAAPEVTHE